MNIFGTSVYALLGGILPALLWLWFWLREDRLRPEPRGRIALTFLVGMITVPLVIPFQKLLAGGLSNFNVIPLSVIIGWAAVEEIFKFGGAYFAALRSKDDDEAIDPMIYMITAALGFAALENVLFLTNAVPGGVYQTLITGNMRFIGATLLHTVSSGAIGVAMALSFFRRKKTRIKSVLIGLILAIGLHTLFNLFIMNSNNKVGGIFTVFVFIWALAIILIMFFEKMKRIKLNKIQ